MRIHLYHAGEAERSTGYSSGFWVILEKHGFLDVTDGPLAAGTPPGRGGGCGIVTTAAARTLGGEQLTRLRSAHAVLVVEGPWAACLAPQIGSTSASPMADRGGVSVLDDGLRHDLRTWLLNTWTPSYSGATRESLDLALTPRGQRPHRQSDVHDPLSDRLSPHVPPAPWGVHHVEMPAEARVVATVAGEPMVAELGNLVLVPQPLLSYLGEDHSARVLRDVYEFSNDRFGIELLLLRVLTRAVKAKGEPVIRVRPWPAGHDYAFTIRHDVDRPPRPDVLERLIASEVSAGAGVSAYFQSRTAAPDLVERFAGIGAEIGWHVAQLLPGGVDELQAIQRLGHEVVGVTVHGNQGNYGWRGLPNWRHYEAHGMSYGENLSSARFMPSRTFDLEDGAAVGRDLLALPHHHSLDQGLESTYLEEIASALPQLAALGAYVVVLNHPDINEVEVGSLLGDLPARPWLATSRVVSSWWMATHYRDRLRVRQDCADGETRLSVKPDAAVDGLVLEVHGVDGVEGATMGVSPVVPGTVSTVRLDMPSDGVDLVLGQSRRADHSS